MCRRSRQSAIEQEEETREEEEATGVRIKRYRPEPQVEAPSAEDPRDDLHRRILGALNRSRLMPYPASTRAEKEYARLCREYRARYGNLFISSSLPLCLVRRPAV